MGQSGDWYSDSEQGRAQGPAVPPQWQQEGHDPYRRQPPPQDPRAQQRPYLGPPYGYQPQQPQPYQGQYQPPQPRFVPQAPPPSPPQQPPPGPGGPYPPQREYAPPRQPAEKPAPAPKARKPQQEKPGNVWLGFGIILAVVGLVAWGLVSVFGGSGNTSTPPAAAPATTSAAQAKAQAKITAEAAACAEKTPGADVYVRTVTSGEDTEAEDTGGNWQWNYGKNECMTAIQYAISQAVPMDGDCVTVAYASANPGYDVDSDPAPPLNDVIAESGPEC